MIFVFVIERKKNKSFLGFFFPLSNKYVTISSTMSQCLCLCFQCDISHSCDIYFSKVKGSRPGKNVQLTENEIRGLCLKSREIFLSQPILLELEAPLKICGE